MGGVAVATSNAKNGKYKRDNSEKAGISLVVGAEPHHGKEDEAGKSCDCRIRQAVGEHRTVGGQHGVHPDKLHHIGGSFLEKSGKDLGRLHRQDAGAEAKEEVPANVTGAGIGQQNRDKDKEGGPGKEVRSIVKQIFPPAVLNAGPQPQEHTDIHCEDGGDHVLKLEKNGLGTTERSKKAGISGKIG